MREDLMELAHLQTDRFGLRFPDPATETDYRDWRIDTAIPFVRIGMLAALFNWAVYFVTLFLVIPDALPRVWLAVCGVVVPLLLAPLAVTFLRGARSWVMPLTALGNCAAGLVAAWQIHEVLGVPGAPAVMSAVTIILLFFAFTIFRLPPLLAALAALPYSGLTIYFLGQDHAAAILSAPEFGAHLAIQVIGLVNGILVCDVLEIVTRRAYRNARIIESQQRALEEERAQISRFLAPEVTDMLRERGIESTLTRQTLDITAVCCDLRGFTAYTQVHGADRMGDVLQRYYGIIVEVSRRYGGTVKDFAGDGALILIGAPAPRADHPQAGLMLARDLVAAVRELTLEFSTPESPLGIGAGVASGPCAVGAVGSQSRLEYTAVGPAVNLAARLCMEAGDGEILISPETAGAHERVPGWRESPMELKGFAAAVRAQIETVAS